MASPCPSSPRSTTNSNSSLFRISIARTSSTTSGSPFTRTGNGEDPSEGKNVTDTFVGSIVGRGCSGDEEEGRRGTDPVAAKIRPQLASSPYSAVLTKAEVEMRDAMLCASLYVGAPCTGNGIRWEFP